MNLAAIVGRMAGSGEFAYVGTPGSVPEVVGQFRAARAAGGVVDGVRYGELCVLSSSEGRIRGAKFAHADEADAPARIGAPRKRA